MTASRRPKLPALYLTTDETALLQGAIAESRGNYPVGSSVHRKLLALHEKLNLHYAVQDEYERS